MSTYIVLYFPRRRPSYLTGTSSAPPPRPPPWAAETRAAAPASPRRPSRPTSSSGTWPRSTPTATSASARSTRPSRPCRRRRTSPPTSPTWRTTRRRTDTTTSLHVSEGDVRMLGSCRLIDRGVNFLHWRVLISPILQADTISREKKRHPTTIKYFLVPHHMQANLSFAREGALFSPYSHPLIAHTFVGLGAFSQVFLPFRRPLPRTATAAPWAEAR